MEIFCRMNDKFGVLNNLASRSRVIIELGVGERKINPDAIGIDIIDSEAVDVVGDVLEILKVLPDASVDDISSSHVLEHLDDLPSVLKQVSRVLKSGGEMIVVVPHFSNPFFYSDPTHRNHFGLYTFSYYCEEHIFRRRVPRYARQSSLSLVDVKLVFKSFPPRYLVHGLRKLCQIVFNISSWTQEIYEDSFSNILSCYEVKYVIRKT